MISRLSRRLSSPRALKILREIFRIVDVLAAMRRHQDVIFRLQVRAGENVAGFDLGSESAHRLERRISGHDDLRGVNSLAQQILAVIAVVRQQNVADVIDQDSVALFRHSPIPCPQARFHMEYLDAAMGRRKHAEAAIGIAQDQQRIGLDLLHQRVRFEDDVRHLRPVTGRIDIELIVRLSQLQILEEEVTKLGREILPCMNHHMVEVQLVELLERRPHLDHFRSRPENRHHLHLHVPCWFC